MAMFSRLGKYQQTALLILRLGIGCLMVYHGYPKLFGGPTRWTAVGGAMRNLGMHDFPVLWGFMAATAETLGGLCLAIGFMARPACLLLLITMIVATMKHLSGGPFSEATHAMELGFVFLALLFIGPGKYSVDKG